MILRKKIGDRRGLVKMIEDCGHNNYIYILKGDDNSEGEDGICIVRECIESGCTDKHELPVDETLVLSDDIYKRLWLKAQLDQLYLPCHVEITESVTGEFFKKGTIVVQLVFNDTFDYSTSWGMSFCVNGDIHRTEREFKHWLGEEGLDLFTKMRNIIPPGSGEDCRDFFKRNRTVGSNIAKSINRYCGFEINTPPVDVFK